jgi:cephalosporin-C deacetylase-like acetyl esterase
MASTALIRLVLTAVACGAVMAAEPPRIAVTPQRADAVYGIKEPIAWTVTPAAGAVLGKVTYVVQQGGKTTIAQGDLDLAAGPATVQASLDAPGTALLTVTSQVPGQKDLQVLGGAVVAPGQIAPSAPRPDDFDAFWQAKLAALAAIPANPVLEPLPSEKPGVDYWHLTLDTIAGAHIHGQLARPEGDKKLPAMLIVQWAGVYGLPKTNVTGIAPQGWLVLNILAHDLPIDQPEAFYKAQADGALKNYTAIGNDDREASYFLRMFLSSSRAVDWLAQRPDWDGKTLVVTGASQGGLQSIVAAGLNPKVTAIMVDVPAGCDNTANLAGRAFGWPYWWNNTQGKDVAKVQETSRYFDAVNFASRVTCPALVGLGLIDTTARPAGVLAAANLFSGPKEIVIVPRGAHQGDHSPYPARVNAWRAALAAGKAPPIPVP